MAKLEVIAGDVTAMEIDCIANAANTQLAHGGGVAGDLAGGGPDVQRESNERADRARRGRGTTVGDVSLPLGDPRPRWSSAGRPPRTSSSEPRARRSRSRGARRPARWRWWPSAPAWAAPARGGGADHGRERASTPATSSGSSSRCTAKKRSAPSGTPLSEGALPLVAPDSFKGTFSAREVAAAIAAGCALRSAMKRSSCRGRRWRGHHGGARERPRRRDPDGHRVGSSRPAGRGELRCCRAARRWSRRRRPAASAWSTRAARRLGRHDTRPAS